MRTHIYSILLFIFYNINILQVQAQEQPYSTKFYKKYGLMEFAYKLGKERIAYHYFETKSYKKNKDKINNRYYTQPDVGENGVPIISSTLRKVVDIAIPAALKDKKKEIMNRGIIVRVYIFRSRKRSFYELIVSEEARKKITEADIKTIFHRLYECERLSFTPRFKMPNSSNYVIWNMPYILKR